jgi:predicted PurR-regulated permease PerM
MPESNTEVATSAFPKGLRQRIYGALVLGGAGVVLYFLWGIARLFLVATLIAYLLDPIVRRLQGTVSRTTATLLVLGALSAGLIGAGVGMAPVVEQQVESFRENARPEQVWEVVGHLEARLSVFTTWLGLGPVALELQETLTGTVESLLLSKVRGVLGIARDVAIVPLLAVFLLRDGPKIKQGLIRLVPNRYFEFSLEAIHKIDLRLGSYLRGIVIQNAIVGGLAVGALWLLEVPSFVLLGVLVGVTNIVPYIGAPFGTGIVVLVQLASTSGSPLMAGLVLLSLLAVQLVDEALIAPVVYGKAVDLHPLEVLLVLWVAVKYFGPVGIVLAVPLASSAKVVLTETTALIQQYRFSST